MLYMWFSTLRLDSIRRHLKLNHHSKRARDVTNYIMDFLDPPKAKAPIETRPYQADPSTRNSYIYQQTMPKNKCFHGYMLLIQPNATQSNNPRYLLVKDPINIPFTSSEELKDPRLDYHTPRTSPSLTKDYSELSELDAMFHAQQETEGVTTTTEEPSVDTT